MPGVSDVRSIVCGSNHCCAVTAEGDLFTWGLRPNPNPHPNPTPKVFLTELALPDHGGQISFQEVLQACTRRAYADAIAALPASAGVTAKIGSQARHHPRRTPPPPRRRRRHAAAATTPPRAQPPTHAAPPPPAHCPSLPPPYRRPLTVLVSRGRWHAR